MSVMQPRFIVSTRIRRRYDNMMTKLVFTIIQTIQIKKPSAVTLRAFLENNNKLYFTNFLDDSNSDNSTLNDLLYDWHYVSAGGTEYVPTT